MVCVAILLSVVFNVWVVRFSLTDFNGILQDNAKCSELIQALEQESTLFESYMRNPDTEKKEALERSMKRTKHAVPVSQDRGTPLCKNMVDPQQL